MISVTWLTLTLTFSQRNNTDNCQGYCSRQHTKDKTHFSKNALTSKVCTSKSFFIRILAEANTLPKKLIWHMMHLVCDATNLTGTTLSSNPAPQQPNWHAECSLSSPPQQVLLSLFLHIHSPPLFHLNNKKLFSLACYLTAVLWIDGCVRTCAWQLLCTPNEFNHQARCQHVISSLCLLGERWNYSGRNGGGGKRDGGSGKVEEEGEEGKPRMYGARRKAREQEEGRRTTQDRQAQRAPSGRLHVTERQINTT